MMPTRRDSVTALVSGIPWQVAFFQLALRREVSSSSNSTSKTCAIYSTTRTVGFARCHLACK
jgi:hypothetical protein